LSSFYTFVAGCLLTSVGQDTVFEGFVDVPISNNVRIGERCHISTGVSFLVTEMGSITIGNRVYLGRNCILASDSGIEIGDNTMLAELVSVIDANHGFAKNGLPIRDQNLDTAPIQIGSDVWVGRGCAILKGTHIGEGSVIGANSVVTRDIPPNAVACGAPARVIKYRE
jgi:acetyltransferase-like isoleucine patch superfamily enzyme